MTRRRQDGPSGREAFDEIERRLGGLLGSLGEAVGRALDAAAAAGENDPPQAGGSGRARARTHVRVRVGGFTTEAGGSSDGREPEPAVPLHESFEDADGWTLTADMPGARSETIEISREDQALRVRSDGVRRWQLLVEAPAYATPERLTRRVTNGVLELRAPAPVGENDG